MYAIFRLMTDLELTHCKHSVSHSLAMTKEEQDKDVHDSLKQIQDSLQDLQRQIQDMRQTNNDLTKY